MPSCFLTEIWTARAEDSPIETLVVNLELTSTRDRPIAEGHGPGHSTLVLVGEPCSPQRVNPIPSCSV
jgi:hypothetical protein